MKNNVCLHLVSLALLCCMTLPAAGGCREKPESPPAQPPYTLVTGKDLFGVASVGSDVWAVGFDGIIVHSGDGGATWQQQRSPAQHNLCDTAFVSPQTGWICGRAGTMLHTADGGTTWQLQVTGTTNHLFALSFVDHLNGWAVGDFGTILHTADGGTTWSDQSIDEDLIYNDVCFVSPLDGWIAGEYGLIYHTSDGGRSWHRQECPEIVPAIDETEWQTFPPSLYGVAFSDASRGWISGMDGTILSTADGGTTWKKAANPAETNAVTLYKVQLVADGLCIIGQKGTALYSSDSGGIWQNRSNATDTKFWLRDLSLASDKRGFAVGSRGTILKTEDAGFSWKMLSGIPLSLNMRK